MFVSSSGSIGGGGGGGSCFYNSALFLIITKIEPQIHAHNTHTYNTM